MGLFWNLSLFLKLSLSIFVCVWWKYRAGRGLLSYSRPVPIKIKISKIDQPEPFHLGSFKSRITAWSLASACNIFSFSPHLYSHSSFRTQLAGLSWDTCRCPSHYLSSSSVLSLPPHTASPMGAGGFAHCNIHREGSQCSSDLTCWVNECGNACMEKFALHYDGAGLCLVVSCVCYSRGLYVAGTNRKSSTLSL